MDASTAAEEVLVVPRGRLVEALGRLPSGFAAVGAAEVERAVAEHGVFLTRGVAETAPEFKQIIPYCVVASRGRVFLMRRRGGGEARLTGKLSIGVGGHVNRGDVEEADPTVDGRGSEGRAGGDLRSALRRGLERELAEEIEIGAAGRRERIGILNDDSNDVGRVHLGLVYRLELDEPDASVREHAALAGGFASAAELAAGRDAMETWSRLLLDAAASEVTAGVSARS